VGGPCGVLVVSSTRFVLFAGVVPEKQLVGTTVRSHGLAVFAPVDSGDVRRVACAFANAVVRLVIDVDAVVVRAYSKLFSIGRGSKNLDPFFGVLENLYFLALVLNSHTAIIACNN